MQTFKPLIGMMFFIFTKFFDACIDGLLSVHSFSCCESVVMVTCHLLRLLRCLNIYSQVSGEVCHGSVSVSDGLIEKWVKVNKLQQREKSFFTNTVADCASVAGWPQTTIWYPIMLQQSGFKDSDVQCGLYFGFNCVVWQKLCWAW